MLDMARGSQPVNTSKGSFSGLYVKAGADIDGAALLIRYYCLDAGSGLRFQPMKKTQEVGGK